MLAVVCGLAAACCWAVTTLASARASRSIGATPTLALVMVIGLAVAVPAIALSGPVPDLGASAIGWLAIAGVGNVLGLFLQYRGVRTGKVGVVATIASTEGAITAVIAIALGEPVVAGIAIALAIVVVGVVLAAGGASPTLPEGLDPGGTRRAALFAAGAAVGFGVSLYAAGRVGTELPVAWAILPARLVGSVAIALPLAVRGRIRTDRSAMPAVVVTALAEVAGIVVFAIGARSSIAVAAVLGSQFGAIAAMLAYLLFHERLARRQWVGVATTAVGVALVGVLRL